MIHYATFVFSILMMIDYIVYNTTGLVWLGIVFSCFPIAYTLIEYVLNKNSSSFCIITPVAIILSSILYLTNDIERNNVIVMSIILVASSLEFMFYITVFSQMGDCTEEFKKNAQMSILLDSSILFVTVASMLQYFTNPDVVIIYSSIVLGGLCIGGGILLYPTISNLITSRSYELTNNDEQEIELGINDDEI